MAFKQSYPRERLPLARSILWHPGEPYSRTASLPPSYPVFVHQTVLDAIRDHTGSAPDAALMGFLAGELCVCPELAVPYVVIDGVFACRRPIEDDDPMGLAQRLWDRLLEEVSVRNTHLVGWYRSHQAGDVSMGPADVALHEARFCEEWHVAVVLRPDARRPVGALYRQAPGRAWSSLPISFYELLPAEPRRGDGGKRTLLPWRNYHSTELVLAGCA